MNSNNIVAKNKRKLVVNETASNSFRLLLFAFLFSISFILNGYSSGISGISLGSVLFLLFIIWAVLSSGIKKKTIMSPAIIVFAILFTIIGFVGFIFSREKSFGSLLSGLLKIVIWVLMITIVPVAFYSEKPFVKWLSIIGIILTIYLFVQIVFFYLGHRYLPSIFNFWFLKPYDPNYANYELLQRSSSLRPASFLSESSFYGNYMLCTLSLFLGKYCLRMNWKRWFFAIFFSIGIIASTSTAAIIFLALIWFAFLIKMKLNHQNIFVFVVFLVLVLGFFFVFVASSNSGFFKSLKYAFEKFGYLSESSRVGKSFGYLSLLNGAQLVFGVGLGNDFSFVTNQIGAETVYLNSITSIIIQTGFFGLICFLALIGFLLSVAIKKRDLVSCILLFIYFIKGFESTIYFSTYGILFLFIVVGRIGLIKDSDNKRV